MKVQIDENANIRALARALIYQSVLDLTKPGDIRKKIDALLWLVSPDFEIWCDVMDAQLNPYTLLSHLGAAKKLMTTRGRIKL